MSTFDQREQALEQVFAHNEEIRFLMLTHRNKLFGRWAADLLQYRGEIADRYIQSIVDTIGTPLGGVHSPDDKIVSRVVTDFMNAGLVMTPDEVRGTLSQFQDESKAAFSAGAVFCRPERPGRYGIGPDRGYDGTIQIAIYLYGGIPICRLSGAGRG
jgi:hypothetical protein